MRGGARASQSQLLGLLPCVVGVAEMSVRCGATVDRLLQVELLHDDAGPEVPVLADNLDEFEVRPLACAVCVDEDRQGLGDTDGVGELDERAAG